MRDIACTEPFNGLDGVCAPNETWRLRNDWPELNTLVELCWTDRRKPGEYGFGKGCLVLVTAAGLSEWKNSDGLTLIFNPDFWRPLWQPIDTYDQRLYDGDIVMFRSADGTEQLGSWGFEDEAWDGENEWVYGAWHDEDGDALGFEPIEWMSIDEPVREPITKVELERRQEIWEEGPSKAPAPKSPFTQGYEAGPSKAPAPKSPFTQGYEAGLWRGDTEKECPFENGSAEAHAWHLGYSQSVR